MENTEFRAGKLIITDFLPITIFIIIPALFLLFDAITLIVFLQFIILSGFFLAIIIINYLTTKIIVNQEYIEYKAILKKNRIYWSEIKSYGTFVAIGLTIISFSSHKTNIISKSYIYVSTEKNFKFNSLKRNNKNFMRFNFNKTIYNLIVEMMSPV